MIQRNRRLRLSTATIATSTYGVHTVRPSLFNWRWSFHESRIMNVGRIYSRRLVTVNPQLSLKEAAELMRKEHVGFLVVVPSEGALRS